MPTLEELREYLRGKDVEGMPPHPKKESITVEELPGCDEEMAEEVREALGRPITSYPQVQFEEYVGAPTPLEIGGISSYDVVLMAKKIYDNEEERMIDFRLSGEHIGGVFVVKETGNIWHLRQMEIEPTMMEPMAGGGAFASHVMRPPMPIIDWDLLGSFGPHVFDGVVKRL